MGKTHDIIFFFCPFLLIRPTVERRECCHKIHPRPSVTRTPGSWSSSDFWRFPQTRRTFTSWFRDCKNACFPKSYSRTEKKPQLTFTINTLSVTISLNDKTLRWSQCPNRFFIAERRGHLIINTTRSTLITRRF